MKLVSQCLYSSDPPKLVAAVLRAFAKVEKNERYTCYVRVEDDPKNLRGEEDATYLTAAAKLTQLESWDASPTALLTECDIEKFDGKYVVLDKGSLRVLQTRQRARYVVQLTFYELD